MPSQYLRIPFQDPPSTLAPGINPFLKQLFDYRHLSADKRNVFFGEDLQKCKGHWNHLFAKKNCEITTKKPLILEIGMHKGLVLESMAKNHPNYQFIGLDITFKRVCLSGERMARQGLTNVFCALSDAKHIGQLFEPEEVDGVVLFFPDPWLKKKKQRHNRLISKDFCEALYKVLSPKGFLWFKTDSLDYFEESSQFLGSANFEKTTAPSNPLPLESYPSCFEKKFESKNMPTYEGIWVKSFPPQTDRSYARIDS